jgi:hypothetical protein
VRHIAMHQQQVIGICRAHHQHIISNRLQVSLSQARQPAIWCLWDMANLQLKVGTESGAGCFML